jgi:YhgE/Pip-like protein
VATVTSIVSPDGDAVVPDGFRPSAQLGTMADGFAGDSSGGTTGESGSLLDAGVSDGLAKAAAYVDGLAVSYPDVAAGAELRAVQGGLGDAQRLVDRVRAQSVLSTQLRTLGASVTSPANAAASSGGGSGGSGATMLRDYLGELAAAYPEVRSLPAWKDAVRAATSLQREPSASGAVDLGAALDKLADHFDGRPDATLSPKALANTPGAKEVRAEATRIFDALPSQLRALSSVFAARSDDIWIPTTLSGDDAAKLNDAVDAFVSSDHAATRFYLTSSNDPYSGDAFGVVRAVQGVVADRAAGFGPGVTGHVGGPTAQFADVQSTLASDFNRVGVMTVAGILLVLVVLLRAIVAPLYLVGTVLVSYASAVGLSGFLFQEVLGQPGVSFYLPLMVFVLLVALGSDYNIFLMHRVREESEHRPLRDGVRIASGRTGAVITSAGLILAGTFGSMATAPLTVLFQVGVAVAIGVLIDTFVVRSILVPAITTLVGDRAWWPSCATLAGVIDRVPLVPVATAAPAPADLRRSRLRLAVAVGLVVLVPVLVASLLTWSFSSRDLGSVRAAVVDLDEGGTAAGAGGAAQQLALGHDLVATLTAPGGGGGLAWTATDGRAASAGLADGSYAAALTIPADFSRSVAAIRGDTTGRAPKATLQVATEDGSGYTLGSVAQAVTAAIGSSTADEVTASYVDDVLVRMTAAHDALASGAADAQRVADDGTSLAGDASGTERSRGSSPAVSASSRRAPGARHRGAGSWWRASGRSRTAGRRSPRARPSCPRARRRPPTRRTSSRPAPRSSPRVRRPSRTRPPACPARSRRSPPARTA